MDTPSETARWADQVSSRHATGPRASRAQGASNLGSVSAWDRYASMAPQRTDPAITYRAGCRTPHGATRSGHPYDADQSGSGRNAKELAPSALTYYMLLGIDHQATNEQIERAHRSLVTRIHPDKFFTDPARYAEALEQLKDVNAMMVVLRDPVRRAEHDAPLTDIRLPPLIRRLADIHRGNRTALGVAGQS